MILPFILKTIWCMNIIIRDYESIWPDVWSQNKCRSLWPIFHGPLICIISWRLFDLWTSNVGYDLLYCIARVFKFCLHLENGQVYCGKEKQMLRFVFPLYFHFSFFFHLSVGNLCQRFLGKITVPRILKFDTNVGYVFLYCVKVNQPAPCYFLDNLLLGCSRCVSRDPAWGSSHQQDLHHPEMCEDVGREETFPQDAG